MDRNTVLWNAYLEVPGSGAFLFAPFGLERYTLLAGKQPGALFPFDPFKDTETLEDTEASGWGRLHGTN
jgi:hypothetical protein